ncbi:hypothetical protein FJW05_17020 [Mesorhizobium sp. B2-9-1]|uniref:hypothetical protein n=1 Tax=Mesorhizobium sp. B2-9-1 TaxID=2589898 RepID=UPI00112ED010|nr:hypothetical protein [Mesorhizobium sp. B2-9-1]TPI46011.1 hypothetical protein FJW05_17020 [Mesorhizobium sp. B2-9-1]
MNSTFPGAPLALARDSVRPTDKIEDDDDYVKDVKTFIRALKFVEYRMTGVRPKTTRCSDAQAVIPRFYLLTT